MEASRIESIRSREEERAHTIELRLAEVGLAAWRRVVRRGARHAARSASACWPTG